jgi:HEAT repeat protein
MGGATEEDADKTRELLASVELADRAADVVRMAALSKLGAGEKGFDDALERALWEPGFKREETSRRRVWAFRCLSEVGGVEFDMDAVRYFVTLDDHAVRQAATHAFAMQGQRLPRVKPYYRFVLPELERRGLESLHQALHDKNGVFRYNVALRLAEIGHPSSVAPLVRSIRRLFEEPLTSTYEYDDAPHHLVWFCKALKRMGDPRGNLALIEGLSSTDPHVRAVIADDPPDDPRTMPALVKLLDDPRSFVRTRAERALAPMRGQVELEALLAERARLGQSDIPPAT